jgi:paraquat-inducible protein A
VRRILPSGKIDLMDNFSQYVMCNVCAHSVALPEGDFKSLECDRCGYRFKRDAARSIQYTLAFSLTALIFYIPANIFPFMTFELYGRTNSSTIWGGILSLMESGSWTVAAIVFLASIVIPILKLIILFYLAATASKHENPKFKTRLYYAVEVIGRWSMLDIFLLAVMVAMVKLGRFGTVHPEIGSLLFAMVVIFTMLASANFDSKILWKDKNESTT